MSLAWYELDGDMGPGSLPSGSATEGWMTGIESRMTLIEETGIPANSTDLGDFDSTAATAGQIPVSDGTKYVPTTPGTTTVTFGVTMVAGGGSSEPSTGTKGIIVFPFACTITGWQVNSNPSGSIEWDMRVNSASIVGTEKPATVSEFVNTSTSMSGWTTNITSGTAVEFTVVSATTTTISSINVTLTREL